MRGRLLRSRLWLVVPLLLLAIVALNWVERPETFVIEETVDMRRGEADYYLEDFRTRRFDASGALEYAVAGVSLSHFPDNDVSEVIAPRVELRRPGAIWEVGAVRGRLENDPDVFTLLGDVKLVRTIPTQPALQETSGSAEQTAANDSTLPAPQGTELGEGSTINDGPDTGLIGAVTITTQDLSLDLDANEVATDAPFEIVADNWRLAGIGLRSTIDEGKLELLSNVYGTYDAVVQP